MKSLASVVLTLAATTDAASLRSKGTSTRRTALCCLLSYSYLLFSSPPLFFPPLCTSLNFSHFFFLFINCSPPLNLTTHSHHAHSLEHAACCRPENGHPVRLSRRIG